MNTKTIFARRVSAVMLLSVLSAGVQAGVTERVSVDSEGREGGKSYDVPPAAISADGRYVAFESAASNLVPLDTNGVSDIFVHDRQIGSTTRVSVDSAGGQSEGGDHYRLGSRAPALSADGRYVAFTSWDSNLVPGDTNDDSDVFIHDRQTGSTTRVSVDSASEQGNSFSFSVALSADGRYVAFTSAASNLVLGDTNGSSDIFIRDRQTGSTTRVSVDSAGGQGNNDSFDPALSTDGRYAVFASYASNLVPDSFGGANIFVHDSQTGSTTRVSVNSAGGQGNNDSFDPALSADGRYVAFDSSASNLVPLDTNGVSDIFVHDRQTGATTRVSVDSAGGQGNNDSFDPALSADGRYVAFTSWDSNLVPGDTNQRFDSFVHDRQTGSTTRVSVDSTGGQGNEESYSSSLSADGRYVAFSSSASNLVPGDTNDAWDIFVHDRTGVLLEGPTGAPSCSDGLDNDGDGNIDASDVDCAPVPPPLMCDGRRVTIVGTAGNDTITGTSGSDVITGRAGDDVIDGAGGNDVVCGGNGNDTLNGGAGRNVLRGGNGNDTVNGGDSRDRLYGGPGDDALNGGNSVDKLHGGTGTDICDGQAGSDVHLGGCETLTNVP